ncbi:MAG: hypothetical protein LBC02_10265 [Planctomycetaceae bacterium]|jgi:hypothetical protein|nr:hypothetical protein [Planctomycetaceae bacterium]
MITTIKAYYNGTSLFRSIIWKFRQEKFLLSVLQEEAAPIDLADKLTMLRQITDNLQTLNEPEPLPDEFDNILSQPIHFKTEID